MLQSYNYLWKNNKWLTREETKKYWLPLDQFLFENFYPLIK